MFGAEPLTRPTRQPFFDAARALLALGYPPETIITARHCGSSIVAMRGVIGELAEWTVKERDSGGLRRERWSPYDGAGSSPGEAGNAIAVSPAVGGADARGGYFQRPRDRSAASRRLSA
jgi:hypothetical protein